MDLTMQGFRNGVDWSPTSLDKMTKNCMKLQNWHFGVKTVGDIGGTNQFFG